MNKNIGKFLEFMNKTNFGTNRTLEFMNKTTASGGNEFRFQNIIFEFSKD